MEGGWYDCVTGSALLAALCRARDIPARLVGGYLLHVAAPTQHYWIEGWGWAPFDLLSWDLSAGGRDPAWREIYFGRLDHRMVVERRPRLFSGAGSLRLPLASIMLNAPRGEGTAIAHHAIAGGASIYCDWIRVERLG